MSGRFAAVIREEGDTSWMSRGACRTLDANLMFPERGANSQMAEAKKVCAACPVIKPCLDYALRNGEHFVWGGKSEKERKRLRADMRARGELAPSRTHPLKSIAHGTGSTAWRQCRRRNGIACEECQRGHGRETSERAEGVSGEAIRRGRAS